VAINYIFCFGGSKMGGSCTSGGSQPSQGQ